MALNGELPRLFNIPVKNSFFIDKRYDYIRLGLLGSVFFAGIFFIIGLVSFLIFATKTYKIKYLYDKNAVLIERFKTIALYGVLLFTTVFLIKKLGYEASWYPISDAIYFKIHPPFLHRILFPSIARFLVEFAAFTPHRAFMLTQYIVILMLLIFIKRWCCHFGSQETGFYAPIILMPYLLAIMDYYTFYDLGIILFYTIGFTLLWEKRTIWYLFLVPVATLNHENFLLLILVSGLLHKPFRASANFDFLFVSLQIVCYTLTRLCLFWLLPVDRLSNYGNIWLNFHYLSEFAKGSGILGSGILLKTTLLFSWFGISSLALINSSPFLRKAYILLPLLIIITLVFGQINEARQFAAFIPVSLALMISLIKPIYRVASSRDGV